MDFMTLEDTLVWVGHEYKDTMGLMFWRIASLQGFYVFNSVNNS